MPAAALAAVMAGCGAASAPTGGAPPTPAPAAAPAPASQWVELGGRLSPLSGHAAMGVAVWRGSVVALLGSHVWRYQRSLDRSADAAQSDQQPGSYGTGRGGLSAVGGGVRVCRV